MASIPIYRQQVQERAERPVLERTYDSPGTEAVAQGVQQLGIQAERIRRQEQEALDDARVQDAYTKLATWEAETIYHPEKGAKALRGERAFGISEKVLAELDGVREEIESGLDDRQRARFERIFLKQREQTARELSNHQYAQVERVKEEKFQAAVEAATSKAITLEDEQARAEEMLLGEGAILRRGQHLGWSGEQSKAELVAFRTNVHLGVAKRLRDAEDPRLGEYLKAHAAEMDGAKLAASGLEKAAHGLALRQQAAKQVEAISLQAGDENYEAQFRLAESIQDVALRDEVVERINKVRVARENGRRQSEADRFGRVQMAIDDSGGFLDRTSPDFAELPDELKAKAVAYSREAKERGRKLSNDELRAQREARLEALSAFDSFALETQASMNIRQQFAGMDRTTLYQLEARQKRAKKDVQAGQVPAAEEFNQMVFAASKGIEDQEELKAFKQAAAEWRMRWYESHGEKPPTRKEIREGLSEARRAYKIPGFIFSKEKEGYQLTPEERAKARPVERQAAPAAAPIPQAAPAAGVARPSKAERMAQLKQQGKTAEQAISILNAEGY